jgi:hypothetical protein
VVRRSDNAPIISIAKGLHRAGNDPHREGHRKHSQVGTTHRDEAFDPSALLSSLGKNRSSFEEFRDLFRMYLVQESTYQVREEEPEDGSDTETPEELPDENGKEEAE